jgi:hypothetical protein
MDELNFSERTLDLSCCGLSQIVSSSKSRFLVALACFASPIQMPRIFLEDIHFEIKAQQRREMRVGGSEISELPCTSSLTGAEALLLIPIQVQAEGQRMKSADLRIAQETVRSW